MREYCRVRLELYEKRKIYQLTELENTIQILSSKCRFILEIIEGKMDDNQKLREHIIRGV